MLDEIRMNIESLEKHPEMNMREQRIRLNIIENAHDYLGEEEWKRYLAMAKRFQEQIKLLFGGGS